MAYSLNPDEIDLLKFNYEKLHDATVNNNGFSWTVSSIFIPLVFTIQGLIFAYFKPFTQATAIYALIIESMVVIWWLIMLMFRVYNRERIFRLRRIELILNKMASLENLDQLKFRPIDQYGKLKYNLNIFGFELKFFHIYHFFFIIVTLINIGLILAVKAPNYVILRLPIDSILIIFSMLVGLVVFLGYEDIVNKKRRKKEVFENLNSNT